MSALPVVVGTAYAFAPKIRVGARMPVGETASRHEEHSHAKEKHAHEGNNNGK